MMERLKGAPVGVCLDTAHAWGAGYGLETARDVKRFWMRRIRLWGLAKSNSGI